MCKSRLGPAIRISPIFLVFVSVCDAALAGGG